jgi:G3E family GTPase
LPIAWAAGREPVSNAIRLAAVVTLVDATNFIASRRVSAAVDAQVAYADVLLVTKSELAGDAGRATIDAARDIAPRASVRVGATDAHAAWLEELLVDPDLVGRPDSDVAPGSESGDHSGHVHDETCRHVQHHAHGIDSVWVGVPGVVDLEELSDQLTELPDNYVRIKGILRTVDAGQGANEPTWTAVHRVGLRVSSEPVGAPNFEEGRLVALGQGVEAGPLAACIEIARR